MVPRGWVRKNLRLTNFNQAITTDTHRPSSSSSSVTNAAHLGSFVDLSDSFIESQRSRRPVIALESTILTHGLPSSKAFNLAIELERIARELNVTPVHIALIDGRIKIGLSTDQIHHLLATPKTDVSKIGRRDLPAAITQKSTGGTTVSATMAIANLVGIKVFATGGIGGVHRLANQTMDISSDLTELARTPVAVVCSGVKSILDIPLTLEYLETLGVPVISFSDSKEFPAFYSPKSGHEAPFNSSSTRECAAMIHHSDSLRLNSGTLIAVPIPNQFTQSGELIQKAVDRAVHESVQLGIHKRGKSVTPWLLNRVKELTDGQSVDANVGLIKNNVSVAAQIATDYQNLIVTPPLLSSSINSNGTQKSPSNRSTRAESHDGVPATGDCRMMVIGAAAIDITSQVDPGHGRNPLKTGSTSPGSVKFSLGGVALNIARTSQQLGVNDVMLVSEIGAESFLTDYLLKKFQSIGLRSDGLRLSHTSSTGIVNMFLSPEGDLLGGLADLKLTDHLDPQIANLVRNHKPNVVCFDGNLPSSTISKILKICRESGPIITAFEPTSIPKSIRIVKGLVEQFHATKGTTKLSMMFPNLQEMNEIHEKGILNSAIPDFESLEYFTSLKNLDADQFFLDNVRKNSPHWVSESGLLQMSLKLLPFVESLLIKNGQHGVVFVASRTPRSPETSQLELFPSLKSGKAGRHGGPDHDSWIFNRNRTLCLKHFPAIKLANCRDAPNSSPSMENEREQPDVRVRPINLINVTGAGDSLCGSVLASLALHNPGIDVAVDWDLIIDRAQRMAVNTLQTDESVGKI